MGNWIFFAILSPLLWGISNVIDAAARRNFVKSDMAMTWFLSATRLPLIMILFLIVGVKVQSFESVLWMIAGGLLWILPFALYYKAVGFEEISRVTLLMQVIPVFTLIIAFFALNERLIALQAAGFILLVCGSVFAAVKNFEGIWKFSKAFWILALASFLWACSDVIFKKFAPSFDGFLNAFSFYFLGSFLVSISIILLKSGRKWVSRHFSNLPKRAWLLLAIDQIFGISGSASFAYALTLGKASLTTVILGAQPLFVLIFNLILSKFIKEIPKEDLDKKTLLIKAFSLILILAGLFLL